MANQQYEVIVSDAALSMLDRHMDFLAKVSKNAAMKAKNEIISDMRSLRKNPERYPVYENQFIKEIRYRKMFSAKRYLIFYEITDTAVYVDYIVDCRQDYEWLLIDD